MFGEEGRHRLQSGPEWVGCVICAQTTSSMAKTASKKVAAKAAKKKTAKTGAKKATKKAGAKKATKKAGAKKTAAKKAGTKKAASKKAGAKKAASGSAKGKQLVIVESPAKAKTINKYLGPDFVVKASVGHIRDLPSKAPKGTKQPVPGVDLEHGFKPTYEVLSAKSKTVTELKREAKTASRVWFATDLDREGEAIAWHLAEELISLRRTRSEWCSTPSPTTRSSVPSPRRGRSTSAR